MGVAPESIEALTIQSQVTQDMVCMLEVLNRQAVHAISAAEALEDNRIDDAATQARAIRGESVAAHAVFDRINDAVRDIRSVGQHERADGRLQTDNWAQVLFVSARVQKELAEHITGYWVHRVANAWLDKQKLR